MHFNVYEAKTRLSSLLDRALAGEEIVIARSGKPLARLVPLVEGGAGNGVRLGGLKRARLKVAQDFHAPLSDDDLLEK